MAQDKSLGWFSRFGPRLQRAKNSTAATFVSMSTRQDRAKTDRTGSESVQENDDRHWNESTKRYETAPTDLVALRGEIEAGNTRALAVAIFHGLPVLGDPAMSTASWLGDDSSERANVLEKLCELFNWQQVSVLEALRAMCSRIILQGETQQIGRILAAVSHQWHAQNPRNGYQTENVVNRVVYSLVLLNTDLHTQREAGRSRLSEQRYVENVLDALSDDLSMLTFAERETERELPRSLAKDPGPLTRSQWTSAVTRELRSFYRSVASLPLPMPEIPVPKQRMSNLVARCNTVTSRVSLRKASSTRSLATSGWTSADQTITRDSSSYRGSFPAEDEFGEDEGLDKLRLRGPPWAKEGPIDFQVFASQKKLHRTKNRPQTASWADAFALVDRGQLRLYRINSARPRSADGKPEPYGEGDWLRSARLLKSFGLVHALAQATAHDSRWSLTLANGRIIQFRCGSHITARDYVYTCNYWAARLSKPPMSEMVASTEYGWGRPVEIWDSSADGEKLHAWAPSDDTINIKGERIVVHKWSHQPDSGLHSGLSHEEQLDQLEQYVTAVDAEMAVHSAHMAKLLRIFQPELPVSERVMANWEARSQWLLKQSVLYSSYAKTLRQVLADESLPDTDPAQPSTPLLPPQVEAPPMPSTPDSGIIRMVAALDATSVPDGVHPLPFPAGELPSTKPAEVPQHHFPFPF